MSSSLSPEVQLIYEWRRAFEERDITLLASVLHDDFRHVIYPKSIHQKTQTKDEFVDQLAEVFPTWTKLEVSCFSCPSNLIYPAKFLPQSIIHSLIDSPKHVVTHVGIPNLEISIYST